MTVTSSPGMMLATSMEKTLGRFCDSREADLPAFLAALNVCLAASFSSIFATIRRSPMVMTMPLTAARVEPGKM